MPMVLRYLLFLAITFASLFGSAGRWDLPFFWCVLGIYVGFTVVAGLVVDPALREERLRPQPGGVDRGLRRLMLPLILCHWVLAGLDVGRLHWTDSIPIGIQTAAAVVFPIGLAATLWAMRTNPFFSPVVRIQSERGHHVVTAGPYRYVRHPGYAASIVCMISGGMALGSWLAMLPVAVLIAAVFRRTVLEDRYLREHLDGYDAYAKRVRSRLLPFVW